MNRWKARRARRKAKLASMTPGRRMVAHVTRLLAWLSAGFVLLLVAAVVLFYQLSDVPRPETIALPQVVTIQYADGSTLAQVTESGENRTIVSLSQVPESVRWAVLAAEDRSFYSEPGVSVKGTLRAAMSDLTGGDTQGGSGITQQYVKNAYLNDSRTLSRKLKELMIAIKLSREYTKDQILEFYLNTVYFGRNAYGIQAAAHAFFGVDVSKLTTAQGAVLAALLRSPAYYDPTDNPQAAKDRWYYVLDGLVATHHITANQEATMAYPKVKRPSNMAIGVQGWKYLLKQRIFGELEANGISENEIYLKGLTIRTTIDPAAQQDAVNAIDTTFTGLTAAQKNMKNALVAVDPSTGGVLAYYGGSGPGSADYNGKEDFNDWAALPRPPGSSFKPYTLATALTQTVHKTSDKLYGLNSIVDGSYCTSIDTIQICNDPSDQGYSSPQITIANALKYSLNTTFDEMANEVGPAAVARTAHAMGISKTDFYGNPTLVNSRGQTTFGIGIGDFPVSPLDQASGFATFADDGVQNTAFMVQKATASDGEVVYQHKAAPKRALDPRVANDVTLGMEPIASWSTVGLSGGRASAAKTGTEGIGTGTTGNSDAWMVGFTPQVSAAVWVGSGSSAPIVNSYGAPEYGKDLPGRTWQAFMDSYLTGKPNAPMPTQQLIPAGGLAGTPLGSQTPSPTPTTSAPPSDTAPGTPSSSLSLITTFAPPSSASSVTLPITPTATPTGTPTATCTQGLFGNPCPTTAPPNGG
jgi:membrane peptidoglycan carboxypeptidase